MDSKDKLFVLYFFKSFSLVTCSLNYVSEETATPAKTATIQHSYILPKMKRRDKS